MTEVVTIKISILTSANYLLIDLKQYLTFFIIGENMGDFFGKVTDKRGNAMVRIGKCQGDRSWRLLVNPLPTSIKSYSPFGVTVSNLL